MSQWESMNGRELDPAMEPRASQPPSERGEGEASPWRRAMGMVLCGMALSLLTINLLGLSWLQSIVGMLCCLLGFRALRRENGWFRACYVLSWLRAGYVLFTLVLNTTVLPGLLFDAPPAAWVPAAAGQLPLLGLVLCLWQGTRSARRKAGLPQEGSWAAALLFWYVLMCLLAWVQYQGLLIGAGMIVSYLYIFLRLYRGAKALEEAGYAVQTVPVRVADGPLVLALLLVLLTGGALGYLLGGSYPMDWRSVEISEHAQVEDIKARLAELGVPEYVLQDLTAEDLAACQGALEVVVEVKDEALSDDRLHQSTQEEEAPLRITGVGVRLPGERERWKIFHHFLWLIDPGFYGTESIQLWPVYRDLFEGWSQDGAVTGRVLYDREGERFAAPYYFLGSKTVSIDSVFWGTQSNTDVFAAFSLPRRGENQRGYLSYPIVELAEGYLISSWVNYTHQHSWLQYPVQTAMEARMAGRGRAGAFSTAQDALQFFPGERSAEEGESRPEGAV